MLNSLTKYHLINSTECKIYNTKKIKLTLYYVIIRTNKFLCNILVHIIIRHVVLLNVMEHAINLKKKVSHDNSGCSRRQLARGHFQYKPVMSVSRGTCYCKRDYESLQSSRSGSTSKTCKWVWICVTQRRCVVVTTA